MTARRPPKPVTEARLRRIALHYLERFPASSARLIRVLERRVARAAAHHDTDRAEAGAWIAAIVADFRRLGYLDDARFAEARARRLAAQGGAVAAIRAKLKGLGLDGDAIEAALSALREDAGAADPDLAAAVAYARRRRLGPYARGEREAARDKHLAALARRGFAPDIARTVLDAPDVDSLEARLRGEPL